MPLVSGATAADFHVVRLLGRGQIGELYLVEHPRLPRQYALKILSADVSTDPEYRFRFSQESARAAALWHPHLVSLYDRGEFEDRLWLSMDYVDGTDAAQLLTDTYPDGMPADMVIEIVSAIADALDYAHEQGLVHGYVNPSNILLTNSESARRRILLTGFGISRRADEINSLTRANLGIGTVSYAAPEQLIDDSIDGRADQYALAGTAFHLLTGSPPFQHMNPTVVISKSLNEPPPRPSDVKPELIYLEAPFARALMKAPNERFERCLDFAKALEARCSLKLSTRNAGAALVTVPKTDNGAPTEPPLSPLPARAAAVPAPPAATAAPPPAAAVAPRPAATAPAPAAAEVGEAVAPPDVLPDTDVDDAITFAEDDAWSAATDDSSMASRRRRRLHMAGLVVTIMAVAVGGLLGVMALRSASESDDTSPSVETSSSVTKVPPPRTAPATAIPPPMVTAPAPVITTPPKPTPSSAATTASPTTSFAPPSTTVRTTTAPPTTSSAPTWTTVTTTTKPHSPPPTTSTTPADLDTRPAVGMPCGPEGTTATSNSGAPVVCLNTPGGSAWGPLGG